MRPFNPLLRNRVQYEVKYGEKKKSARGKSYPAKLDYLKVVSRNRNGDNFEKVEDVHSLLGDKPKVIPIIFFSDDPSEIFSLYRGTFDKATLICGAHVGDKVAMRRARMFETTVEDGVHSGGNFGSSLEIVDEPYGYLCNDSCVLWQKNKCKIYGKLHFMLNLQENTSCASSFFVLRIAGVYAQMAMSSSIDVVRNMTGGILANIPLRLRLDYEKLNKPVTVNGKSIYPDIPYLSIEPGLPMMQFMEIVRHEWKRRDEISKISGNPIRVFNVIRPSLNRENTLEDVEDSSATEDVVGTVEETKGVDWDKIFEGSGFSKKKMQLFIQEHGENPAKVIEALAEEAADDLVF